MATIGFISRAPLRPFGDFCVTLNDPNPLAKTLSAPVAPLSVTQQREWALAQLLPTPLPLSLCSAARLDGDLKPEALQRAWSAVVHAYPILRTVFPAHRGYAEAVLMPQIDTALLVLSLPTLTVEDAVARGQVRLQAQPFNLERGPLVRVAVINIAPQVWIALMVAHRLIADETTLALLMQEWSRLYDSIAIGTTPLPPADPFGDAAVAVQEREWLASESSAATRAYWQAYLRPAPERLELPTDHPRPAVPRRGNQILPFTMPKSLSLKIEALTQQEGTTPQAVCLATYAILLYRYTHQADIAIGYPVAALDTQAHAAIVGPLATARVYLARLSDRLTFCEVLAQVHATLTSHATQKSLPFATLVRELGRDRTLSHAPLFQAEFAYRATLPVSYEAAGVRVTPLELWNSWPLVDVSLHLRIGATEIQGALSYRADLFAPATMESMQSHFTTLLSGALGAPRHPIARLPLLDPAEAARITTQWNQTAQPYPDVSVPMLFAAQVRRTPDAIALTTSTQTLSYKELGERVRRVALHLQRQGVQPGDTLGLGVSRQADLVVGALAIMSVGAAYVPLDPAYPTERLSYMLADAAVRLVLTESTLHDGLPLGNIGVLDIDTLPLLAVDDEPSALPRVLPDRLAYLIYTSGSTGTPKGVQISHRALTNFLLSMARTPGFTAQDTLLAVTSLAFDIAGLELYLPLITGGQVRLATTAQAGDGSYLREMVESGSISVLQATPATWRLLVAAGWEGTAGLTMLCGGEALPAQLAAQLLPRGKALWNMYGPTETTIWSAVRHMTDEQVTIGYPIANTTLYVLDRHLAPVPVGVSGELYIGGTGVARGYRGKAALTAERFIPDPFSTLPGARLYRTGDVVRSLRDGTLSFLGRTDHQVKVRGFRIELGEIESALEQHPAIRQAAAMVVGQAADARIVAYVVLHPAYFAVEDWRSHSRHRLPEYMVPSECIVLDSMPLTPNGKVDRRALVLPATRTSAVQAGSIAPRTMTESTLAALWMTALGVPRLSVTDNVFALGGHSLLAMQVAHQIKARFGITLAVRTLFEASTVAQLAQVIDEITSEGAKPET
jgi:amino acid adenylation domain-containing protein